MITSCQLRSGQVSYYFHFQNSLSARFVRKGASVSEQKNWRVLRHEDSEEGGHHKVEASRSCDLRKYYTRRHRSPIFGKLF